MANALGKICEVTVLAAVALDILAFKLSNSPTGATPGIRHWAIERPARKHWSRTGRALHPNGLDSTPRQRSRLRRAARRARESFR